jgi:hypothetical protein
MLHARLEVALGAVFVLLAVLTAAMPTWIEEVFKVDPDAGSGALEWIIVAAFGVLALVAGLVGRSHYLAAKTGD